LRRRRPTPGAQRLGRPISIGAEPSAGGRHARRMNSASGGLRPTVGLRRPGKRSLRRRRPTPGAQRLERLISIGAEPSADGRPARRMNSASRGLWPVSRPAPTWKSTFCVGGGRRLARSALRGRFQSAPRPSAGGSACTPNEFGLQGPLAGGRPTPTWKSTFCVSGGRRLARQRLRRPISIGVKGLRPVVGLRRPGKAPFASAEADAWRASA
jgi:hypothetical protein